MNSKIILVSLCLAFGVVGLFQLTSIGKHNYPVYNYKAGQIADQTIKAPFDFQIYKTPDQIKQETANAVDRLAKPYVLSTDAEFKALSNLDKLFALVYDLASREDTGTDRNIPLQSGFVISESSPYLQSDPDQIRKDYETVKSALESAFKIGIYQAGNSDSLLIFSENANSRHRTSEFLHFEQARLRVVSRLEGNPRLLRLIEDNADRLILPNLVIDENRYKVMVRETTDAVGKTSGNVLENDEIIHKNKLLTEEDIQKLESLSQAYKTRGGAKTGFEQLVSSLSLMFLMLTVILTFNFHLSRSPRKELNGLIGILGMNLGLLGLTGLAVLNLNFLNLDSSHIPLAMAVISAAILFGYEFAVFFNITAVLLLTPFLNWEAHSIVLLLLSPLITLALMQKYQSKHHYIRIWFFQYLAINIINLGLVLLTFNTGNMITILMNWLQNAGYALVSTTISVVGCLAIVTFFEKRWRRATKQVLLELLDFNHPLLKKLATNAPGTYHHSLIVGNLAEQAAEAIGANALLARVGSYYHDIGKIVNSEMFTENNEDTQELYESLTSEASADVIRNHVREGIVLATKYHLPKPVIDIISQHHGTSYIRYFLEEAQRNNGVLDPSLYRYGGPLPHSKEAALVMLADILESTTKSKQDTSDEEILRIYEETVQRIHRDGQFDDAPITFKDLADAKEVMFQILESIYRKRLDYPEERV